MKGRVFFIVFFSLTYLLSFSFSVHGASTLYVTSSSADLKSDKSASSSTVTTLGAGAKLSVISTEGKWHKVSGPSGVTGWIYRGKVSKSLPSGSGGGLFGSSSGSSIELSQADTARSIRGLSPEAEEYAKNARVSPATQQALDRVLARKVSDHEITGFLKEGKIGEYAP